MRNSSEPKYKKDDIVGVFGDAMYELRITSWQPKHKLYVARCLKAHHPNPVIKAGQLCTIKPSQIAVRLGANGRRFPPLASLPTKEMRKVRGK